MLSYPYCLDDYCDDVFKVLNALNIKKCHLIAHSFGGRIAVKIASSCNLIDKLILTGSAGLKPKRKISYYLKVFSYKAIKIFLNNEAKNKFGSKELKSLSGNMRESYYKIVNEHLDNLLRNIKAKTLII